MDAWPKPPDGHFSTAAGMLLSTNLYMVMVGPFVTDGSALLAGFNRTEVV